MVKVEAIFSETLTELVQNINSWIQILSADLHGFKVISISHSNPNDQHPKYSAVITYECK